MKSMTGFGYSESTNIFGTLVLELSSLNRKFFDLSIYLPRPFTRFEMDIRKVLSSKVARGAVTARYSLYPGAKDDSLQTDLLQKQAEYWRGVAKKIGSTPEEVTLSFLLREVKDGAMIEKEELNKAKEDLLKMTQNALSSFLEMREKEGKTIALDLKEQIEQIEDHIDQIEKIAPAQIEGYKKKLEERIEKWSTLEFDERVMREVAFLADKIDIREEIVRLRSHIAHFLPLIEEERPGKKMDFYLQEMMREANTIASKSVEADISKEVIQIKHAIEQMREQVQNVE